MSKSNKVWSRLSLTQELTISVTASFIIMIIVLSMVVSRALVISNEEKVSWQRKSNLQIAKNLLIDPVWSVDVNSIKNATATFVSDENQIVAVRVFDEFGELLAENRSTQYLNEAFAEIAKRPNHFLDTGNIYKLSHKIGTVELVYSNQKFNDEMIWVMIKLGFSFFAIGICFSFIILWRLKKTITDPVNRIVKNSQKIAEGNYQFQAEDESVLEFQKITNVLNIAIKAIDERDTELKQQIYKAQLATVAKTNFVSNMSHEIRTPLNAIIGLTELSLECDLDSEVKENLMNVKLSADSLLLIINDILDFSKVEAGKLQLETIEFNILDTFEECERILRLMIKKKQISFKTLYPANFNPIFYSDPLRIKQILLNLLNNAIKFTPEYGQVTLKFDVLEVDKLSSLVRFEVRDTGIGIDKSNLENIFEAFSQEDQSTTRKYGGTGLGLSISKKIINQMNGVIGVDSVAGQGSAFWFQLRIKNTKN
ncbi:MAG: hypothetical protein HOP07_01425 [Bacteriovoracaceae bacterium]|nr:hypothetical protein [Bacteriovoracaceae bacterium]